MSFHLGLSFFRLSVITFIGRSLGEREGFRSWAGWRGSGKIRKSVTNSSGQQYFFEGESAIDHILQPTQRQFLLREVTGLTLDSFDVNQGKN